MEKQSYQRSDALQAALNWFQTFVCYRMNDDDDEDDDDDGHGDDTDAETNEKEEASLPRARNSRSVDREIETKIEIGIDFRDQWAEAVTALCIKPTGGDDDGDDENNNACFK